MPDNPRETFLDVRFVTREPCRHVCPRELFEPMNLETVEPNDLVERVDHLTARNVKETRPVSDDQSSGHDGRMYA